MYKKMKRLYSILCSILCLSGSTGTNVISAENNVASIDKKLFSKKMRQFVNSEIKSLKYNKQRIGLNSKSLRLNGRLSLLTLDGNFDKKLNEALKTLDLNLLKKYSVDDVRWKLRDWCFPTSAIISVLSITVALVACLVRVRLSSGEIDMLNKIRYDENVKIIAKHFGFGSEIVDGEDEIELADPIDEEQFEKSAKYTIDPSRDKKIRKELAVRVFKILLKAQIENFFGMLPKDVEDAFSEFRRSKMFRDPGDKKWDICAMLKWYWMGIGAASVGAGAISAGLGLMEYMFYLDFQRSVGKSEEIDVIIGKMEELMKSSGLRLPKTNDSSSPNNTKKNSKKVSSSKLNFDNKKIIKKKKSLNVRDDLKFGSVKSL